MSGWEGYIYQIQHKYNVDKKEYVKLNICQHAAIYGNDGTAWAVSSDWPGLNEYQHEIENDDGSHRVVCLREHLISEQMNLTVRFGKLHLSYHHMEIDALIEMAYRKTRLPKYFS